MHIAALFILMTLAPFGERPRQRMMPRPRLFGRLYGAEFTLREMHEEGGQSLDYVSTGCVLAPLEFLALPGLKSEWMTKTPIGEVKTEQTVSYGVRRLPFDLFLVTLQIDKRIEEPGKTPSAPIRSNWFRILHAGRCIDVNLGKDERTENRRIWGITIKEEKVKPG